MKINKLWFSSCALIFAVAGWQPGFGQVGTVSARMVPATFTPIAGETVEVAVWVDMSGMQAPDDLLASYQASLRWDAQVLQYDGFAAGDSPWDTPVAINDAAAASGLVFWNDFLVGGAGGEAVLLRFIFRAIGSDGADTRLNLTFDEMRSSTFKDLLPNLDVRDIRIRIGQGMFAPIADAGPTYAGAVGVALPFDASGSSDPDGQIVSYRWDFGDGSEGSGVSPAHTYFSADTFQVILQVTDNDGLMDSDTTKAIITPTTGIEDRGRVPDDFRLLQNYPNPFNPGTTIEYRLPSAATVRLRVVARNGVEVRRILQDARLGAGLHRAHWDGRDVHGSQVATGLYFYELTLQTAMQTISLTKKMLLVR